MASKPTTYREFFQRFPDDDACLEHLMRVRYGDRFDCPKCKREARYYRIRKRRAYECEHCGNHVFPAAGTPFEKSRTPLQSWFYAMFLFCATRNGVSAKELQRQLGVTYKCAWRMGHEIRKYMAETDGDGPLGGKHVIVEADKAFVGGKDKQGKDDKAIVLGIVERGGDLLTRTLISRGEFFVVPQIKRHVRPGTRIATDEGGAFRKLSQEGFRHGMVNHSKREYVRGPVHTNTIEAFWVWMKRQIEGTHVWVSKKHLPKYLGEMEYRFNLRKHPEMMFDLLMMAFVPSAPKAARIDQARREAPHLFRAL